MELRAILKRKYVITLLIGGFSFIFSLYTVKSYQVALHARGSSWNTGGPGSFFPWPTDPGHLMVITEMSPIDAFFNQVIIETGILALCSFGVWCTFLILVYKITKNQSPAT